MAKYIDGFLLPLPKRNIGAYVRMSRTAGRIWRKYGALEYRECVGDDLDIKGVVPFPRTARVKKGETVVFSWIVYRSKNQRKRNEEVSLHKIRTRDDSQILERGIIAAFPAVSVTTIELNGCGNVRSGSYHLLPSIVERSFTSFHVYC